MRRRLLGAIVVVAAGDEHEQGHEGEHGARHGRETLTGGPSGAGVGPRDTSAMEIPDLYERAVDVFGQRVHAITPDQWHLPTRRPRECERCS